MKLGRSHARALGWGARICTISLVGVCVGGLHACADGRAPLSSLVAAGTASAVLDAGAGAVRARFELAEAPMPLGAIPFPDDLYLDSSGRIAVSTVPGESRAPEYMRALRRSLSELDGFSAVAPVFFGFDGELAPESLPANTQESLEDDASVFLVDVDPSSPEAFSRVPVEVHFDGPSGQLALRPAAGHPLRAARRYAAVVTTAVRSTLDEPVLPAPAFAAIRDPDVALTDPRWQQARLAYEPVLETLERNGLPRTEVVALAVFRVQQVLGDLEDARALVQEGAPPAPNVAALVSGGELDALLGSPPSDSVGLDVLGGAPHDHIATLVQGTFSGPGLLSAAAKVRGAFERNDAGELRVKRSAEVPFSLWLPLSASSLGPLPVVLVQHGEGGERADALAIANTLCGLGFAVLALDAPFHGLRGAGNDAINRFTGEAEPDGFGDAAGAFTGEDDVDGPLAPFHPFYRRDAMRQGVVDLMGAVRLLQQGDFSVLGGLAPELAEVRFDTGSIGFVGLGEGAEMGVMLAAVEPSIGAFELAFAAGGTLDSWLSSPRQQARVQRLAARVGRDAQLLHSTDYPPRFWPELAVFQTLLERGEAQVFAPLVRRLPINALILMARDDEQVANASTEALAFALRAQVVGGDARHLVLTPLEVEPGQTGTANFVVQEDAVTRILFELDPADHYGLQNARGEQRFERPLEPPYTELSEPKRSDNALTEALEQLGFFFQSWRSCVTASTAVCAARVQVD